MSRAAAFPILDASAPPAVIIDNIRRWKNGRYKAPSTTADVDGQRPLNGPLLQLPTEYKQRSTNTMRALCRLIRRVRRGPFTSSFPHLILGIYNE